MFGRGEGACSPSVHFAYSITLDGIEYAATCTLSDQVLILPTTVAESSQDEHLAAISAAPRFKSST